MFGKAQVFPFDVALPTLHGTWGEDGTLQGLLAAEGVPMACGGVGPMGLTINKMWTLHEAMVREIPVLSSMLVRRGDVLDAATATKALGKFPLFIKPNTLGSSMGAHKVDNEEELQAALADVFRLDTAALVQPCVPNLVEYNVAVRRKPDGTVVTSAIERPLRKGELLSFEDKYAHSGTNKLTSNNASMATMDRELNPKELGMRAVSIRTWAEQLFVGLELSGAPRLDFLCNEKTGDIWFNEINPIPGGLGWFLWGAAPEAISFTDLLTDMVTEAQARTRTHARVVDPVSTGGAIFGKRG
jgi:D-alanine-D-alanine ligase